MEFAHFCLIDGMALFCATLRHFEKLNEQGPLVLAATHFHGKCMCFSALKFV